MRRKTVFASVRFTEEEYYKINEYATIYNLNISELIRNCTLSDFLDNQVEIKTSDIVEVYKLGRDYLKAYDRTRALFRSNNNDICRNNKDDIEAIHTKAIDKLNYMRKSIENMRKQYADIIKEEITSNDKKKKNTVKELSSGNKQVRFVVSQEEFDIIKKMAEKENMSVSKLLKKNIFLKCQSELKIFVDIYSCEELLKNLQRKINLIHIINDDIRDNGVKDQHIKDIKKLINSFTDLIEEFIDEINYDEYYISMDAISYLPD